MVTVGCIKIVLLNDVIFTSCIYYYFIYCVVSTPKLTIQPSSQQVNIAQNATFSCQAVGYKIHYRWTIGSGSFPSKVTGINTNTLVIPDVILSDGNIYICTVSNSKGTISSNPVKLTIKGNVHIL